MLYNFLIKFLNSLIAGFGVIINTIFFIFPDSPFQKYIIQNNSIMPYLRNINYFIPVAEIIVTFEAVLVAVSVYYIYQIVLRWIKVIE